MEIAQACTDSVTALKGPIVDRVPALVVHTRENKVSLCGVGEGCAPHFEVKLFVAFGVHCATTLQGEPFVAFGEHYTTAPLQWRLASFGK